ncbi:MAG: putative Ig domain-containing protein [Deltaproteobacteria bacterium]|jgi:Tol biopolymer transport system component
MRTLTRSILPLCLVLSACSGDDDGGDDVTPAALEFVTLADLPGGTVGEAYNTTLNVRGGDGTYTFALVNGAFPAGLDLTGATVGGTPTMAETATFRVEASDGSGQTTTRDFTLTIEAGANTPTIVTAMLPGGTVGTTYDATITASGGDGTYTWSATPADLPPGLTLGTDGSPSTTLSGTPITEGTYTFDVRVTDGAGESSSTSFTVTVNAMPLPLQIDTMTLPAAVVGEVYSADILASNGSQAGYTWAVTVGALPPGLVLRADATPMTTISGTPTMGGTFTATISVSDSAGGSAIRGFTIDVTYPPLAIAPANLPNATLGATYTSTLTASGGTGTGYSWAITAGALPAGMNLVDGGATATIEGAPTALGTSTFTVELSDDAGATTTIDYTVEVFPPLAIDTPSLAQVESGTAYTAAITASGGTGVGYAWSITNGALPAGLTLAPTGTPSTMITGTSTAIGTYDFTVGVTDSEGRVATATFRLVVAPPIAIVTAAIASRPICTATTAAVSVVGGIPPFAWTTAGTLPAGLQVQTSTQATIFVTGRGTTPGTQSVTFDVTDSTGATASRTYAVTVTDDPGAQRLLLAVGDLLVDNDTSVFLFDVCGDTPGAPVQLNPSAPGVADASTANDDAAFSPDGTKVAFIGDFANDTNLDLWVVDLTASPLSAVNLTSYTAPGATVQDLRWAPNSSYLAFTADPNLSGSDQLFFVDVTTPSTPGAPVLIGGATPPLDTGRDVSDSDFFWAPDSSGIVFHGDLDLGGVNELYYANTANAAAPVPGVKIHAPLTGTQDCEDDVLWAPDASGVLFRCDIVTADQDELWFASFTGGAPTTTRVNNLGYGADNDVGFSDYAFNAQSTALFYIADETINGSEELWLVRVVAGVLQAPQRILPALTAGLSVSYAAWDPSGTRIAFRADIDADDVFDLYIADVSATIPVLPTRVSNMPATGDLDASSTPGFGFAWSNDGTRIAFVGDQDLDGVDMAYVADVSVPPPYTSRSISPMTTDGDFDVSQVYWSPDDSWIAFRGDFMVDGAFDLYVTNVSGAGPYVPQMVNSVLPTSGDVSGGAGAFEWRADSRGVFFESDMIVNNDTEFWMSDLSSGAPTLPLRVHPMLPTSADGAFFYLNP